MRYAAAGAKGRIADAKKAIARACEIGKALDVNVQLFDADMIVGLEHVASALSHALRAFDRMTNTSGSLMNETLLYASGERQVRHAIAKMGIREGDSRICTLAYGAKCAEAIEVILKELAMERDDAVLTPSEEKLRRLGISNDELIATPKDRQHELALERVAVIDIKK